MIYHKNNYRWMIVGLLFLITILNYIDRASIAYAVPLLEKIFHLTPKQIGLILGVFGIGYLVMTFCGGVIVDKMSVKKTLTVSAIFWSLAILLTGFASSLIMLLLARLILGLAEGPNFPAMTKAISHWLPIHERGKAFSFSLISVPIALAIGGPIVSLLIKLITWRGMFIILGILVLLWLPFWWYLFKDKPEESRHISKKELALIQNNNTSNPPPSKNKIIPHAWKHLFTNKTLLANYWGFFVFGYYLFFFMSWLPDYFIQAYHLNLKSTGYLTVLPWACAAVLLWLFGYFSDLIYKKTKKLRYARSYLIVFSQLIAFICVLPLSLGYHTIANTIVFICLAVGFAIGSNAIYYAINIDIFKSRAGTALGIMDTFFAISGFLAPTLTGEIISLTHHFKAGFFILACLSLSSILIILIFHQPDKDQLLD